VHTAESEIIVITPLADVAAWTDDDTTTATLAYETVVEGVAAVSVSARGWNVYADEGGDVDDEPAAAAAALAAAALGVGEPFRIVFAHELGERGRRGGQPTDERVVRGVRRASGCGRRRARPTDRA
jgi:hypothetical protein